MAVSLYVLEGKPPFMKPVRYKPAPTRIRPSARRRKPERKGIQITSSSEVSPGVQRPAKDALVVSALCCVCSVVATERVNTATPREMSAQFGSFRRAIRKTDETAYTISTSPSRSRKWRTPIRKSSAFRHRFSRTARLPPPLARSMKRIMPAPNRSENKPMNFWSMKISPKTPTAQSSHVSEPPALRLKFGPCPNLKETAFMRRMPSTATPRIRSRLMMRSGS